MSSPESKTCSAIISEWNEKRRNTRERWNCRPKRQLLSSRPPPATRLIGFVVFHRQSAPRILLGRFLSLSPTITRLPFVKLLEDFANHRRCAGAAVDLASDIALVKRGEGVLRLIGR